jgi:hypothetical protein
MFEEDTDCIHWEESIVECSCEDKEDEEENQNIN